MMKKRNQITVLVLMEAEEAMVAEAVIEVVEEEVAEANIEEDIIIKKIKALKKLAAFELRLI